MKRKLQMLLIAILAMMWAGSAQAQSRQAYAVLDGYGKLTFYYDMEKPLRFGGNIVKTYSVPTTPETTPGWAATYNTPNTTVRKVNFDSSFAEYRPTSTYEWFYGCKNLYSIDLTNLNTSEVTDMRYMFSSTPLVSADFSSFDTQQVTDMSDMFQDCQGLRTLNLLSWNTASVTNMNSMFRDCSSLQTLDLTGFDTRNVTSMFGMFMDCQALTGIDVSEFKTDKVMDMSSMFQGCRALTELDLTNWDTANASGKSMMFSDCSALTTIVCDDTWTGGKSLDMFLGCTSLVGGPNGTVTYDATRTDIAMANPTDGYFTLSTAVGITAAEANGIERDEATYNLSGQRVGRDFRGITVRRGRKVLKK